MLTVEKLLRGWGIWLRYSKIKADQYPVMAVSKIYRMMEGQTGLAAPRYQSVIPVGVELNDESDKLYSVVDKAVAALPRRRREAVMVEFVWCINGRQEDKGQYMSPAVKQNTFSELIKFALNQIADNPEVKMLLK